MAQLFGDLGDGNSRPNLLPENRINEFTQYLAERFQLDGTSAYDFGDLDEETYTKFNFKSKNELLQIIRQYVTKKLYAEKYCVDVDALKQKDFDFSILRFDLKKKDFIVIDKILGKKHSIRSLLTALKKYKSILLQYPKLLMAYIDKHPDL